MYQFQSKSGKTITLRPPTLADVQIMLDYINEIGREDIYVNVNPDDLYIYVEEEFFVRDVVVKINLNKCIYYLAFDQNTIIGSCSIFKYDKRRRHLGLFGITLRKDYRNDGIGYQLSQIVINDAIRTLNLRTIILEVFAPNQVAYRLYQKLGFKEYGILPDGLSYKDGFIDGILMYKRVDET
jgi:RimJ/RimL family protein N-acetyltransferase